MNIGEKIRSARKEEHLTQVQLAEKAGIAVNSLRLYEAGKRSPNTETLRKIMSALGIEYYWDFMSSMLDNTEEMRRAEQLLNRIKSDERQAKVRLYGEKAVSENEAEEEKIEEIYSSECTERIVFALAKLNASGQEKAVERVEELTEIPKYQISPDDK